MQSMKVLHRNSVLFSENTDYNKEGGFLFTHRPET